MGWQTHDSFSARISAVIGCDYSSCNFGFRDGLFRSCVGRRSHQCGHHWLRGRWLMSTTSPNCSLSRMCRSSPFAKSIRRGGAMPKAALNRTTQREKTAYQGCATYVDFRDIIARSDIDAVCIASPDHWHAIPVIEACKAGKDVYCEKPLTLTIEEARRCVEAARTHKRIVQTGSQQRSNVFGPFREAVEIIRSGRLGRIHRVTVGCWGSQRSV